MHLRNAISMQHAPNAPEANRAAIGLLRAWLTRQLTGESASVVVVYPCRNT